MAYDCRSLSEADMQFKKVGDRIQILAYVGYDKEKRRAKVQMVGSLRAYSPFIDDELRSKLNDEQLKEIQAYIDEKKEADLFESDKFALEYLPNSLNRGARLIRDERFCIDEKNAHAIFAAIDELKKALREQGFKKPAKPQKPVAANDAQTSLL